MNIVETLLREKAATQQDEYLFQRLYVCGGYYMS